MYDLYCLENEEYVFENADWKRVKEFGFDIIKDRSNSPYVEDNDELSLEFAKIVSNGIENVEDEYIKDVLKEWGFQLSTAN